MYNRQPIQIRGGGNRGRLGLRCRHCGWALIYVSALNSLSIKSNKMLFVLVVDCYNQSCDFAKVFSLVCLRYIKGTFGKESLVESSHLQRVFEELGWLQC